jgi:hypothetical protein
MRLAISSRELTPRAMAMRRSLPKLVDEDLVAGMAFYVFEEERGAAGFGDAVGDLGDFQFRGNFFADALQLAVLFEGFDPVAQIVVGHGV